MKSFLGERYFMSVNDSELEISLNAYKLKDTLGDMQNSEQALKKISDEYVKECNELLSSHEGAGKQTFQNAHDVLQAKQKKLQNVLTQLVNTIEESANVNQKINDNACIRASGSER